MPVAVRHVAGSYRIVDVETGRITKNVKGDPVDQGGGPSQRRRAELERQARAINARLTVKRATAAAEKLEACEAAAVIRRRLQAAAKKKTKKKKRKPPGSGYKAGR